MSHLIDEDCLRIIFNKLNKRSLYSCILVNRFWCRIAIQILWEDPYYYQYKGNNEKSLYNTIIYFLPKSSKQLLINNDIILPSPNFSNQLLFNYISFSTKISDKMINSLIKKEVLPQENYKLLEQEVYKLFFNNCIIKEFLWVTTQSLFQYPKASNCLSKLCTLNINIQQVTSTTLFGMAQICQNIENLNIYECNSNIPGLINFIDIQKNLKSLTLNFEIIKKQGVEKQCKELSSVIERKAATIKKISIDPNIVMLSPKFLLSLVNLENLYLYNGDNFNVINKSLEMQEWEKYLSLASFPNLQYLIISSIPFFKEYYLIEKTNGNIIDIDICYYGNIDLMNSQRLIKVIAKHCPKLERLKICVKLENLIDIKEMFINCTYLKTIFLHIKDEVNQFNYDELLEILVKFSSKSLNEVHFFHFKNWIFTIEGLRNFFENWRDRIPIKFFYYVNNSNLSEEHRKIFKKYYDEGLIKENFLLDL